MPYQTPYGMHDILPEEQAYWRLLREAFERLCKRYGFSRIDTPVLEYAVVFSKGVGQGTDIVDKEMYYFEDKGGDWLALRPEFTAGVVRAYLQNGMRSRPQPVKLYSIGPLFRRDRPGAGRYRQFHQVNAEIIGTDDPAADAELVEMAVAYASEIGISSVTVQINSTGCTDCKPPYIEKLAAFLSERLDRLGEIDRERAQRNPLRVLDSKDEKTKAALSEGVPLLPDHLCESCRTHYQEVMELLAPLDLPLKQEPTLVRGLDYYTRTVFEITSNRAPEVGAVLGGGRYDGLAEILDGPPTPAAGFAGGMERMILALKAEGKEPPPEGRVDVFVAYVGEGTKQAAFRLAREFRRKGFATVLGLGGRSLKSQLKSADRTGAPLAVIVGAGELAQGKVQLRSMSRSSQELVPIDEITEILSRRLREGKP